MAKVAKVQSWIETLKQKIGEFFASLDLSSDAVKKMGMYAGIGFAVGFVLRKFGTLIFFALLLTVLVLYGLSNTEFLSLDLEKLKLFLGFTHKANITNVVNFYWDWVTNHIPLAVSFCVGFLFWV